MAQPVFVYREGRIKPAREGIGPDWGLEANAAAVRATRNRFAGIDARTLLDTSLSSGASRSWPGSR